MYRKGEKPREKVDTVHSSYKNNREASLEVNKGQYLEANMRDSFNIFVNFSLPSQDTVE